jgi:hypothetical protein
MTATDDRPEIDRWADDLRRLIRDNHQLVGRLGELARSMPAGGTPGERADALFRLAKELGVADSAAESVHNGAAALGARLATPVADAQNASVAVLLRVTRELSAAVEAGGGPAGVGLLRTGDIPRAAFRYLSRGVRLADDGWGFTAPSAYYACVNVRQLPPGHPARSVLAEHELAAGELGSRLLVLGWSRRTEAPSPLAYYLTEDAARLTREYRGRQDRDEAEARAAQAREDARRFHARPNSFEAHLVERIMSLEMQIASKPKP